MRTPPNRPRGLRSQGRAGRRRLSPPPRQPVSDLRARYLIVRAAHRVEDQVRDFGAGPDDFTLGAHPMRSQVAVFDTGPPIGR